MITEQIGDLIAQRDILLAALKKIYDFSKYAAAIKKENTDEFLEEFFVLGEAARKQTRAAIAFCEPKKTGEFVKKARERDGWYV